VHQSIIISSEGRGTFEVEMCHHN